MPKKMTTEEADAKIGDKHPYITCTHYAGQHVKDLFSVWHCSRCKKEFRQHARGLLGRDTIPMCGCVRNSLHPLRDRVWLVGEDRPAALNPKREPRKAGTVLTPTASLKKSYLSTVRTCIEQGETENALRILEILESLYEQPI